MPLWRVALTTVFSLIATYFAICVALDEPRFGSIFPACLVSILALLYLYMLALPPAYWLRDTINKRRRGREDAKRLG